MRVSIIICFLVICSHSKVIGFICRNRMKPTKFSVGDNITKKVKGTTTATTRKPIQCETCASTNPSECINNLKTVDCTDDIVLDRYQKLGAETKLYSTVPMGIENSSAFTCLVGGIYKYHMYFNKPQPPNITWEIAGYELTGCAWDTFECIVVPIQEYHEKEKGHGDLYTECKKCQPEECPKIKNYYRLESYNYRV